METRTETRDADYMTMQIVFGAFVPEEDQEFTLEQTDQYLEFFDEMLGQICCPS